MKRFIIGSSKTLVFHLDGKEFRRFGNQRQFLRHVPKTTQHRFRSIEICSRAGRISGTSDCEEETKLNISSARRVVSGDTPQPTRDQGPASSQLGPFRAILLSVPYNRPRPNTVSLREGR